MRIDSHAAARVGDLAGGKIEGFDIGDAPCPIDNPVSPDDAPDPVLRKRHPQAGVTPLDSFEPYADVYDDSDALARDTNLLHGIGIHLPEQPRQRLEDRHLRTRARVDVPKLERDDAATHEHDLARKLR